MKPRSRDPSTPGFLAGERAETPASHEQPLSGLRVLDFTVNLPGPYATLQLAGLGAEVIKIEAPRGDPARTMPALFSLLNGGKRSAVLDLRADDSQPKLQALVRSADVLVEGFRPGVMARLGGDWATARQWNQELIYCSISAYGQDSECSGHDLNLQAVAGLCHLERGADGAPRGTVLPIADLAAADAAVSSILAALFVRERGGGGTHLEVAMSDGVAAWCQLWGVGLDMTAPVRQAAEARGAVGQGLLAVADRALLDRYDREKLYTLPHYGIFETKDREHLAIGIVDENHFWRDLCGALGLGALSRVPFFARAAADRPLRRAVRFRIRRRSLAHWLDHLTQAGLPVSAVRTPRTAPADRLLVPRRIVDSHQRLRPPLPAAKAPTTAAPALGEHTAEIIGDEVCG